MAGCRRAARWWLRRCRPGCTWSRAGKIDEAKHQIDLRLPAGSEGAVMVAVLGPAAAEAALVLHYGGGEGGEAGLGLGEDTVVKVTGTGPGEGGS